MAEAVSRMSLQLERFRKWYQGSLVNRATLKGQLLVGAVLIVIGSMTYMVVSEQVRKSVNERLEAVASLNAERLRSEIDRVLSEVDSLSRRSLVANGLADSHESNAYLRPFLQEYRQSLAEIVSLSLVDGSGQILASAEPAPMVRSSILSRSMSAGKAVFELETGGGIAHLHLALPVVYEATGQIEGVLLAEIDLLTLMRKTPLVTKTTDQLPLSVVVTDNRNHSVLANGEKLFGEVLQAAVPIGGVLAQKGENLTLTVNAAKGEAYTALSYMGGAMIVIYAAAAWAILLMTRRMSETIVAPLSEMSHRAMEIAGAGPTGLRELSVTRCDEIGWMGTAFNEMVFSLRESYASQEAQVRRRTEELGEAREMLTGVLASIDDVVYSIDPDFAQFTYISPAASKVFGYTVDQCLGNTALLQDIVWLDDLPRLQEVRRNLVSGESREVRYRIVHADGTLRWVVDRFHLVCDDAGVPLRVSGLVHDVTASVAAEASLLLRERALASSSCGVVITDMLNADHPILYVNTGFERITGYKAAEVIGRNCAFLQGEGEENAPALEEIRQAIAEGRESKVVIRNFRKDGEAFWNELQLSPLHDEHGLVTHYIGVQNDISASIAATQALVDSEQRLALTIDALHEGVWDWNIAEDRLFTSPSWAGILGVQPGKLNADLGIASFYLYMTPEWAQRVQEEIQAHLAGSEDDFYLEHQMRHADGQEIWVANHGRVVERAENGVPSRMVGTIVDITQRIENSHQIIGLMSQLDSIFTLSPDAFVYFNDEERVTFVNPAFERMTGIKAGEATGIARSELRQRLKERADPAQAFPFGEEGDIEANEDGHLLYLLTPACRVLLVNRRASSNGGSAVVYLRDVTRETEVDRMKSEFLSTAAHELRTPMASIMGFAELLMLREFSPERTKDMLSTMHRQARRLTDLINELLDLARIEARAGKDFKIAHLPFEPVVRDAVAALHVDGDRSRMRLDVQPALPEIDIDPAKMQQAVINLLSNAYKYSPQGGPIDIHVGLREKGGSQQVGVVVRDHGIGMSPEQTARVFERFFRADPSGNIPGTGLGMSLVKEIMDSHGGSVEIESAVGVGTTAGLWLPVNAEQRQVTPEVKEASPQHGELTLWLNEPAAIEVSRQLH